MLRPGEGIQHGMDCWELSAFSRVLIGIWDWGLDE